MRISDWSSDVCSSDLNGSSGAASLIVTGAPLTNDGAIVVEPGAGGVRSIEADLVNNGEVTFNAVTAITGAGGVASNEADAVLTANADVTVTGAASFRNSGTMTVAAAATLDRKSTRLNSSH